MSPAYPRAIRAHATARSSADVRHEGWGLCLVRDLEVAHAPNPRLVPSPSEASMPVPRRAQCRSVLALVLLGLAVGHFARLLGSDLFDRGVGHLADCRAWRFSGARRLPGSFIGGGVTANRSRSQE